MLHADYPAFDDQAVLSPDGRSLAFVSTRGAGSTDIHLLDLQSGDTFRARGLGGQARLESRIVSVDVASGARTEHAPAWEPAR